MPCDHCKHCTEPPRPPADEPTVTKATLLEWLDNFGDDEPIYVLVFGDTDEVLAIVDHGHAPNVIGTQPDGSDGVDGYAFITALVPVNA